MEVDVVVSVESEEETEDIQKFGDVSLKAPPEIKDDKMEDSGDVSFNEMGVDP